MKITDIFSSVLLRPGRIMPLLKFPSRSKGDQISNLKLRPSRLLAASLFLALTSLAQDALPARPPMNPADNGIAVIQSGDEVRVTWPISADQSGSAIFNLDESKPLITSLGIAGKSIAQDLNPVTLLTIGERDLKNPAGWVAFFDDPPLRPHETFLVKLGARHLKITTQGTRTTISLAAAASSSFSGDQRFTFYRNSPLIHAEVVLATQQDGRAIIYDTGLVSATPAAQSVAWNGVEGKLQRRPLDPSAAAREIAVAGRAIVMETKSGSLAAFPAPHQFFYPLDEAYNLKFVWHGRDYSALIKEWGFGIRQSPTGDKRHVPWFNAPPNTQQHLGVFYLLDAGDAANALAQVMQYTRGDHFKPLPGYKTFTSHFHVEHTQEFLRKQKEQSTTGIPKGLEVPGFVKTFKARGVNIAHLAEFHYTDGSKTPEAQRLINLKTMHAECARLSDDQLLILPGEEPNIQLGGHWISLFPKPIYWTLNHPAGKPFVETVEGFGTVYHPGTPAEVLELMEKENGLMWTAHARIKASMGFPDAYKDTPFFHSDHFLGAAWKAMEADLSRPTLGWRVLNLLDDMNNWGRKKQAIGEVDTFRMEPDYETYAHMNINYVKLDRLPRFSESWQPILDTLRGGRFFVTSGEVLIPDYKIGGQESGQTLDIDKTPQPILEASLEWTFPLAFAEVVSGDGQHVFRQRIDLSETESFGARKLRLPVDLTDRTWVRFEVWDIAANGAFTQPIWLTGGKPVAAATSSKTTAPANTPATWASFVPERKDDFAWENDLVAFRAYGPAIRPAGQPFKPGIEDSGVDCWTKRVPYPIVDKWYSGEAERHISYHDDHGEGLDLYSVGSSRGCGGTAIWKNSKMYISGPFKSWKLISREPQKSIFELTYDYDVDGEKFSEVKRVTIELGQRLFKSESTFTKDGKPAALDIAIGVTTHEGRADPTLNPEQGWMSCWETIQNTGLGTGVAIAPARITAMRDFTTPDSQERHALLLTRTDAAGQTVHYAGFGWSKAGQITSPGQWNEYLATFAANLK